jgi:hypothetical protein
MVRLEDFPGVLRRVLAIRDVVESFPASSYAQA